MLLQNIENDFHFTDSGKVVEKVFQTKILKKIVLFIFSSIILGIKYFLCKNSSLHLSMEYQGNS